MAVSDKIMLGEGIVSVGGTAIGLTRGGSVFKVEREIRNIEADGDRGGVKGRVVIDSEVAKLTVNALDMFTAADMVKYYPGIAITAITGGSSMTGTLTIAAGDYVAVTFVGKTKDGKAVTISLVDALNLANIEWALEDKSEVVSEIEFTSHYDETARNTAPWSVLFATA